MPNALAEIGAVFGIAVRLPSLVVAGMAFDLLEGTLPFLDACIALAPLASLPEPSLEYNPVLRLPPEIWAIIRTHAIRSALTDSETVFAEAYVGEGRWCTCIKYSGVEMPRRIDDIAKFMEEVGCDCGEQDTVRKDAVHSLMDGLSRDNTARKLVSYFSLDCERDIVFNPDRLAESNQRDLETAVLLTVPLKKASTYSMAAVRGHEDEGFDTAVLALPTTPPPAAYKRFQRIIADFHLQPVDVRHRQIHWEEPQVGQAEQDGDPPDGLALERRLWDRRKHLERFRDVTLEELPPRWMLYAMVEGSP
ncbi:RHTO0S02e08130g1_1 [Rhodotorula toruloides]|uniref:RHTO0S02e08130g1_1 n=1 Tax=Rhodotorula toruloides TaxID=5286 RepID=A0A061AQ94_RHOTO|nr:hypothetical protein OF846_000819 [Rhodotorula toruloides]CDR36885.1 RHTO0S02e08130g1_1 [Rhodotorula toruloides]